jgi:hypothetical protein
MRMNRFLLLALSCGAPTLLACGETVLGGGTGAGGSSPASSTSSSGGSGPASSTSATSGAGGASTTAGSGGATVTATSTGTGTTTGTTTSGCDLHTQDTAECSVSGDTCQCSGTCNGNSIQIECTEVGPQGSCTCIENGEAIGTCMLLFPVDSVCVDFGCCDPLF